MIQLAVGPLVTRVSGLENQDPTTYQMHYALSYQYTDMGGTHRKYLVEHIHGGVHRFPTGLLPRAIDVFTRNNIPYELASTIPKLVPESYDTSTPVLRPYQVAAVRALVQHTSPYRVGGVLQGCTGAGKTAIAAKVIQILRQRTLFMVHTRDLMTQAKGMLEDCLNIPVGQIGNGVYDPNFVTVGMVQSLQRGRNDFLGSVSLVIADEAHHLPATSFFNTLQKCSTVKSIVGLSASPWRDDGHDMLIEAACGPIQHKISASELIDMGYLVQPEITALKIELPPILRGLRSQNGDFDAVYDAIVSNNERRHQIVADQACQQMALGRTVLVLVKRIPHGQRLAELIPGSTFLSGGDSTEVRQACISHLQTGQLRCVIATSILDEGIDLPRVDSLILAGAGRSSTRALQRIGRVLRCYPGKTRAWVIEIVDDHPSFTRQFGERRKIYRTEPRFLLRSATIPLDYEPKAA